MLEPEFKKRKIINVGILPEEKEDNSSVMLNIQQQQPFSNDVITEISKYIENITDYFNLALTNKTIFNLMMKEHLYSLNELFKNNYIKIVKDIPNYLYNNLHYLNIIESSNTNSLQNCLKLKSLCVNCCDINDNVLQNMVNLKELMLLNCKDITGIYLNNLIKLKGLEINIVNIYDKDLINLKNLNTLSLTDCKYIKGTFFKNLKQLTTLHIDDCNNIDYRNFSHLINLKELYIWTEDELNCDFLQNLINLEYLEMHCNGFKDDDFKNLKNLKTLLLFGGSIDFTGDCFIFLNKLEILNTSDFIWNMETKNIIYLTNLNALTIFNTIKIKYLENLTKLEFLCAPLYDEFKKNYNFQFQTITELQVVCDLFKGKSLIFFPNLKKLNVSNTKVEDKYLENLTKLKKLDISECPNLFFGEFLLKMDNLKHLVCNKNLKFENKDLTLLKSLIRDKILTINEPRLKLIKKILSKAKQINKKEMKKIIKEILQYKDSEIIEQLEKDKKEMQRIIEEKENEIEQLKLLNEQLQ